MEKKDNLQRDNNQTKAHCFHMKQLIVEEKSNTFILLSNPRYFYPAKLLLE